MRKYFNNSFLKQSFLAFTGLPLLIWVLGSFPQRSTLKESLSVVTILSFSQMIGLFFLSRSNGFAVKELKMSRLIRFHKIIGYSCLIVLFLHPFLLVVPRFFESGIPPGDAFISIITTFTSQGVVLGIIAWCLMLTLGISSLIRKKIPMKYTAWRTFHGILAVLFIASAACHVIDLGRHSNLAMTTFIILSSAGGVLLLLKTMTSQRYKKTGEL